MKPTSRSTAAHPSIPARLDIDQADVALLLARFAGQSTLTERGWTLVYRDPLAVVYVHHLARYDRLLKQTLPGRTEHERRPRPIPLPDLPANRAGVYPAGGTAD